MAVTAGTTNEAALQTLSDKQGLGIKIVRAPDHAAAFALLQSGEVEALAGDDVLLYGLIAKAHSEGRYKVVGEYLSYDPYGLVYRRDDPDFAAVVERTFRQTGREPRTRPALHHVVPEAAPRRGTARHSDEPTTRGTVPHPRCARLVGGI